MTVGRTSLGLRAQRAAFALAAMLCAIGLGATAARAAAPLAWAWTPPARADSGTHSLTALTCRSASLCVAVDGGGDVFSSTAPVKGVWHGPRAIHPFSRLAAVSCPSSALCLAVDNAGNAYYGAPATSASTWTPENIDMITPLSGISCPSVALCVAVDRAGNVLASTSAGNPITWSLPMPVDGLHALTAVSCPTVSLCAAVDDAGDVLVSTNPTSMSSWHRTPLTSTGASTAVSCNASALCVAVASGGRVYATASVVAAPVTWSATPVDPLGSLSAASCSDVGLCVVLDRAGTAFESDNPTASRPTWASTVIDAGHAALSGVSCLAAGFCVAADDAGDTLAATLPAPAVTTGSGTAWSQTAAELSARVNPNDAMLVDCHFDYGVSTAYGGSVPCSAAPAATSEGQAAVARINGLRASTTYHFRIAVASGVATADGGDALFTTPPPLKASPALSGTAAVGSTLACTPHVKTTPTETLTYAWLRDSQPIAGATTAGYLIVPADQTHHLSCQVTVSGDGGSASATSGFDAVPLQVVETFVGQATRGATSISAPVTCSPMAAGSCTIRLRLSANRIVHHRRQSVIVGSFTTKLRAGRRRTLSIPLNAVGQGLLKKRHRLAATMDVSGTVVGTLTAKLRTEKLVFGTQVRRARRPQLRPLHCRCGSGPLPSDRTAR